ncbi:MAG: hypothetical protein LBO06_00335 [Bacteroidales bacterium]|jgi:hypothetical protein|nr:hypothetical protein [Bacteroidales bacterium]
MENQTKQASQKMYQPQQAIQGQIPACPRNANDKLCIYEEDTKVLQIKVTKLFYEAINYKGISKSDREVNTMAMIFCNILQNDFEYIAFERIEKEIKNSHFEYGNREHFNVSPDLFVKILTERGLYRQNKEWQQKIAREKEAQAKQEEEEAKRKYYMEHEQDILRGYANKAYQQWLHCGETSYVFASYKYFNQYRQLFTEQDRLNAKERIINREKEQKRLKQLHTEKIRQQAAIIMKNTELINNPTQLSTPAKIQPPTPTSTNEQTVGCLINEIIPSLNCVPSTYQPSEKEIEQELVIMIFEKTAKQN